MGEVFSNEKIGRRLQKLVERIVEKESVVIHQLREREAEQRRYYR